ncbi:hypothetical protein EBZ38_12790 [bacterium]|nr:hypothetical protein [bacterium]
MARRSAMQMDPRTMTGAPRGGGMARSLAPRPQMGPPRGGSRQPMTQSSQPPQEAQMMGEAIGNMQMDAGIENAQNQQNAMDNQFNDLMQRVNNYQEPAAPNLMSPPGFGPKPGRMDPRMQGQMQDMMGRLQRSRQSQPSAPMPQYDMPGPSSQYDFVDRRKFYTPINNFDNGNRMPGAPMGNGFEQFRGNQMQPAPRPTGQPQQMPQGMQQPNSMSNFLNRNRFGR